LSSLNLPFLAGNLLWVYLCVHRSPLQGGIEGGNLTCVYTVAYQGGKQEKSGSLTPLASSRGTRPTQWLPFIRGGLGWGKNIWHITHDFSNIL